MIEVIRLDLIDSGHLRDSSAVMASRLTFVFVYFVVVILVRIAVLNGFERRVLNWVDQRRIVWLGYWG